MCYYAAEYSHNKFTDCFYWLHTMSLHESSNFRILEVLRENIDQLNSQKCGIISSSYKLCRVAKESNDCKHRHFTCTVQNNTISLNYGATMQHIFQYYGLNDIAKEDYAEIAITVDGVVLTKSISHVTVGIKFVDRIALNLTTRLLILKSNDLIDQSRELCFPMTVVIVKDCQSMYDEHVSHFFRIVENNYVRLNMH